MYTEGYIKLNRTILKWAWYKDANTLRVFLHLLLNANYEDCEFETHLIKRGQLVTGRKKLSKELDMSEQEVRTALNHLKSTNEITIKTTSKYSIITILSYDEYLKVTNELTGNQPTVNQQATSNQPQYNKDKNNKKDNKGRNSVRAHANRQSSYLIEEFEKRGSWIDSWEPSMGSDLRKTKTAP